MTRGASSVEERLGEFKRSLDKYMHLLKGGRVDVEKSLAVERVELEAIAELRENGFCRGDVGLEDAIRDPKFMEWLNSILPSAAERIGVEVGGSVDAGRALAGFLAGDLDAGEARVAALMVQSLARCLAEERLESRGVEDSPSPYCPLCGAESRTMVVRDTGYHMVCPFCAYEWRVSADRVTCPYCGNSDPVSMGVFTDKKRRVGLLVCQKCGETWRAVLDRSVKAPRILIPVLSLGAEAFRVFVREEMLGGDKA